MEAPDSFQDLVDRARHLTAERVAGEPGYDLYISVKRQLDFIDGVHRAGRPFTQAELDSFTFGRYAAREFEATDMDYALLLQEVAYRVKRL